MVATHCYMLHRHGCYADMVAKQTWCSSLHQPGTRYAMMHFAGTDPEDVIRNAFACFDEENVGKINEDRLRELLTTMGDRFTDAEV